MKSSSTFRAIAVTVVFGLAATLTACAAEEPQGLTLAESKSPVQLLRNEAASRVPSGLVDEVTTVSDGSTNCRSAEVDPQGLERSWTSNVRITLLPEADLDLVMSKFIVSFREDGWEQGTYGSASIIEFTRDDSVANIHVSTKRAEGAEPSEVQVKVSGPCVKTDGEKSDEVKRLEVKAAAAIQ